MIERPRPSAELRVATDALLAAIGRFLKTREPFDAEWKEVAMISASDVRRAMTAEYTDDEYVSMARLLNSIVDETERILTIAKTLKAEYRRGADADRKGLEQS